jgi:hypothetical protein
LILLDEPVMAWAMDIGPVMEMIGQVARPHRAHGRAQHGDREAVRPRHGTDRRKLAEERDEIARDPRVIQASGGGHAESSISVRLAPSCGTARRRRYDISLEVRRRDRLPSTAAAGETTTLRAIVGLLERITGTIEVKGRPTTSLRPRRSPTSASPTAPRSAASSPAEHENLCCRRC